MCQNGNGYLEDLSKGVKNEKILVVTVGINFLICVSLRVKNDGHDRHSSCVSRLGWSLSVGCLHHVLDATEGVGDAVEEIALGEDNAHRFICQH